MVSSGRERRRLQEEYLRLEAVAKNYVLAKKPAEFSVRVFAEASRSAFEVAQEDIAFIPSSSACGEKEGLVLFC